MLKSVMKVYMYDIGHKYFNAVFYMICVIPWIEVFGVDK